MQSENAWMNNSGVFISAQLSSHLTAGISAFFAGSSTFLAMLRVVLTALLSASRADLCTKGADLLSMLTSETHKLRSSVTDGGTFHVVLNAFCHHLNVFFLRAGRGTMVTNRRASKAGFNTFFVIVITFHKRCFCEGIKYQSSGHYLSLEVCEIRDSIRDDFCMYVRTNFYRE